MSDSDSTTLAESFSHMARLRFRSQNREEVLDALLRLTIAVVPDADTSSVAVRGPKILRTLRAHDDRALSLDEAQYRSKRGPCIDAVRDHRQICTPDFSTWSLFGKRAMTVGVRCVLSTPVPVSDEMEACLNLYSSSSFSSQAAAVAIVLAEHLGPVIGNILDYEQATTLNAELTHALKSRELVALAKGILMGRERCSEGDALRIMVGMSQRTNRKLLDIATDITRSEKGSADG